MSRTQKQEINPEEDDSESKETQSQQSGQHVENFPQKKRKPKFVKQLHKKSGTYRKK